MDELFEGVWERVHPDIPDDAFKVIIEKIAPIRAALCMRRYGTTNRGLVSGDPLFANACLLVALLDPIALGRRKHMWWLIGEINPGLILLSGAGR